MDAQPAAPGPVVIEAGRVDVEQIQEAIRARVAARARGAVRVRPDDVDAVAAARLDGLDAWNLPRHVWQAMWPPQLEPWNLEQDFPIESHRGGLGRLLVALKRLQRGALRWLARPLLAQQVEINRTTSLLLRTLAAEVATERARVEALEERLARVTSHVRELGGEVEPLVVFADERAEG